MKNLLVFIGVLFVCVNAYFENGTIQDSPADKIKDNPGKCYVKEVGLMDEGSEVKVSGKCERIQCLDGGKYRVNKCNLVIVEWPCYSVYPDKPFPECCDFKVECIERPTPVPPKRN